MKSSLTLQHHDKKMLCQVLTPRSVNLPTSSATEAHYGLRKVKEVTVLEREERERERESCYYQTVLLTIITLELF